MHNPRTAVACTAQPAAWACRLASPPRPHAAAPRAPGAAAGLGASAGPPATRALENQACSNCRSRAPLPSQPLTPEELAEAKSAIEGLVEKGQTLNLKTQARAASRSPCTPRLLLVAARSTRVPPARR